MGFSSMIDTKKVSKNPTELLLNKYSDSYYKDSISLVSDEEFDSLKDKFFEETGKQYVRVGGSLNDAFGKITHKFPMLSLEKVNDVVDLRRWTISKAGIITTLVIDWKLDGMSLSNIYEYGTLVKASTRGDGKEGEDVTRHIPNVDGIPTYIEALKEEPYIEVRGEVLISKDNFDKLKEANPKYTSARNLASGSMKLKTPEESKGRCLDFISYYLYDENGLKGDILECYLDLVSYGFRVPEYSTITARATQESMQNIIDIFEEKRKLYPYQTDGLVIKVNHKSTIEALGATSHHPKSAIAYKFEAETAWSTLLGIEWNVSRSSRINPVALIEPTIVGDVTVSRLSVHNLDIMKDLDLKIGDKVLIKRANDVIPQIIRGVHTEESTSIEIPKSCPTCGGLVHKENQFLYCINKSCKAVLDSTVLKFCRILEIVGVGESIAENIATKLKSSEKGYYEIMDFDYKDWVESSESIVIGQKLLKEMDKAKERFTTSKAIESMFIDNVGSHVGEKLAQLSALDKLASMCYSDFVAIDGIGDVLATNLFKAFDRVNNSTYDYFIGKVKTETIKELKSVNLNNMTFCVTGTHPVGRTEIETLVKENGGKLASGVSKNLSYLIAGEKAGSKLDKAKQANVKVIDYNQFMELIKDVKNN